MVEISVLARNIIVNLEQHKVLVDRHIDEEGGFFIGDEWVCLQSDEDIWEIERLKAA